MEGDTFGKKKTPLHNAIARGHDRLAQYLISFGAPLPYDALLITLGSKEYSTKFCMIKFLINQGVSVLTQAPNGDTVLPVAAASLLDEEGLDVVALLIRQGCKPTISNKCGATPLHIAIERGRLSVVDHFLSLGISLPSDILFSVIEGGFQLNILENVLRLFIANGADVLAVNANGDNLLHIALARMEVGSSLEHLDAVKVLFDSGCDPQAAGQTPLHMAITKGLVPIVE